MEKPVPPVLHGLLMLGHLDQISWPGTTNWTIGGGSSHLHSLNRPQVHWTHSHLKKKTLNSLAIRENPSTGEVFTSSVFISVSRVVFPSSPCLERPMLFTACNQPEHEQNWIFHVDFTSARLLMLGQSRSVLQLGWPLLSLFTVEARLARLEDGITRPDNDLTRLLEKTLW